MAVFASFSPYDRATLTISVTTSSANTGLTRTPASGSYQVRVYNAGAALVFVRFAGVTVASNGTVTDGTAVTATTADIPIPAGNTETFTVDGGISRIATIAASGTATLYVSAGEGI